MSAGAFVRLKLGKSSHPRSGMVIFGVLLVLFVLGALFFLLSRRSMQLRHVTIRILEEGLGYQRALGCATLFWRAIEDCLAEQAGCALLFPPPPAPSRFSLETPGPWSFTLEPKDLACHPGLQENLRQLCALPPEAQNLSMRVLWEEKERTPTTLVGQALLTVNLEIRQHPLSFTFVREFRVFHMLPPVTAKHTLFVRKTRSPEMYNLLTKTFQTDSTSRKPLILYHSDRPFVSTETDAWLRSGWVYLGGPEVVLALDGTHPSRAESENFLFWPTFVFDGQGQVELPYACSPYFPGTLLRVRFTPIGAMEEWQTDRMLMFYVGVDAAPLLTRSSILRLFGDRQRMTPTRVLGRVKSRYVLYSTMIYDANDDGFPDVFQPTLGRTKRAIFPIRRLVDSRGFQPPHKPRLHTVDFYDLFTPLFPRGIPQHIGLLFPAYNAGGPQDYLLYMTKLNTDFPPSSGMPFYNGLYDQMFDAAGGTGVKKFPPPRRLPPEDYPNQAAAVVIPSTPSGEGQRYPPVDLTTFDPLALLAENRPRLAYEFPNQAVYWQSALTAIRNGVRHFERPQQVYIEGDLDLTPAAEYSSSIFLWASGNVTIGRLTCTNPSARCVIVAGKDVRATGHPIEAGILAPRGHLSWTGALRLKGFLAVDRLEPEQFSPDGGAIEYDTRFDPSVPAQWSRAFNVVLGPWPSGSIPLQ